jgi:hypothetical protein
MRLMISERRCADLEAQLAPPESTESPPEEPR